METDKKVVFSGVQPTGIVTLGNYLGAIRNWRPLQEDYNCIYCVVDLHSLTVRQVPSELRANTTNLLALYLACGIDPDKSIMFIQSHVPAHTELSWILDTIGYVGELSRMTQYKSKAKIHSDNVNMGLLNYPVLMASDILLYQTDLVPVGQDQKQHLELARTLAERFNNVYSPTFVVPEGFIPKNGAKIMSLADPSVKMSKSDDNINAFISLGDDKDTVVRKFKRAVTDSDTEVRFSKEKSAVSNLLTIYSLCADCSIKEAEIRFEGKGYGYFKEQLAESVIAVIEPIQVKQKQYLSDKGYLDKVLQEGAQKANAIAERTLSKVYRKVGFIEKHR
ncbi:MAG: tryptophan--tRNA ligase [Clostridia bacterium]